MKKNIIVLLILIILSSPALSAFKENERSIYTVISSTAYTAGKKGLYWGPEGLAFGLSDYTQTNIWGFLGYGAGQNMSMGIGLGIKQKLIEETENTPALSFDINSSTIVNPDKTTALPDLLQPYNVGAFNNASSFGFSVSKKLKEDLYIHSGLKLYDYNLPSDAKYKCQLVTLSVESWLNDWARDYIEINYDYVNVVFNYGIKFDIAPTDMIRVSLGYMTGVGQLNGLYVSQFIAGAALHF